jgi:predicted nucleic acid-binding protein
VSMRYLVDTNVLLRFLTGEPVAQALATKKFFARAATGELVLEVSPVIVAETLYTLLSYYEIERKEAVEKIATLLRQPGFKVRDTNEVFSALERLKMANVGFADAFLAASGAGEDIPVASFDRDFDKFKDVKRFEPTA